MLSLLLMLSGLGRLTSAGHHPEPSLLQITVPRKIGTSTNDGEASETHVTYAIKIDRKRYTLHLEKQSFLDPHFLVYAYNKSGTLYPDSSFKKGHCLYQGYAAEVPKSVVTLSTCSGLRGLLLLQNVSYGIEPLESAAAYEHMLYQIKNNKIDFSPVQENYTTTQLVDQPYRILVKSEKNSDVLLKRVLKIQVVMDKALFDYMGSEVAIAAEKVVHIFGLINTMFSQLNMTIMLTSLELWSDQNKISLSGDANEVLQRFVSWKEQFLFQRSHDMAYLLIYRDLLNYVGATYHGMACNPKFAAGIALPEIQCLQNQKVSEVVYQGRSAAACGNGILEPPEQCDCGLEGECSHRKCCNPVDCTLIGFAECGSGPCCDRKTCLIAERGRLCRQRTDPCDFPEFCNGTSTSCVPDVKSIDLEPCNNKTAFCFGGVCQDPDVQCEKLFGKFAKVSTYLCTQEVNFQADIFGNCGNTGCSFGSILCGKLVCHWTHSEIVPKSSVHDVQYTYLGGHICLSAHVRNDTTSSAMDLTQMSNGTMCGYNKYCFDGLCEDINNYPNRPNCESEKNCSGHGICNDRLNCHCDVGYSPPICLPSPSSPGGSYNDGFWHPQNLYQKTAKVTATSHQVKGCVARRDIPRAPNCPLGKPTANIRAGIKDMKLCCAFCFCSSGSSGSRQTIILKDFVCKLPYQRKYGQQSVEELNHIAFLPHNFRVYGYNGTGSMKPLEQQFQNFCYYQGYIEGYPNSMAIVSTCSGLRERAEVGRSRGRRLSMKPATGGSIS